MDSALPMLFGQSAFDWADPHNGQTPSELEDITLPDVEHEPQYLDEHDEGFAYQYDAFDEVDDGDDFDLDSLTSSVHAPAPIPERTYEFRPRPQDVVCFQSTWIDNDKSGTYDPKQEGNVTKQQLTNRKRYVVFHNPDALPSSGEPKKSKVSSLLAARQAGVSFVLTLELSSEAGRALLGRYTDNWPGYLNVLESNDPLGVIAHDSDGEATFIPQARLLRSHYSRDAVNGQGSAKRSEEDAEEDLTGHPANRGCRGCIEWGLICPLRENAEAYPCAFCVEAETDCELCQTPERKRSCEDCKRKKIRCSYLDSDDHSAPCQNCTDQEYKCVAGPEKGSIRPRISLDKPPRGQTGACDPCRKEKLRCSLSWDPSGAPLCTKCEEDGLDCTRNRVEKQRNSKRSQRRRQKLAKPRDAGETSPLATSLAVQPPPQPMMMDMEGTADHSAAYAFGDASVSTAFNNGSSLIDLTMEENPANYEGAATEAIIQTSLAYPIKFNHDPDRYGRTPCHFCQRTRYGILGLGTRQVRVLMSQDGQIIREVSGGHTETGHAPTRICQTCCMARVEICLCEAHHLERLQIPDGMALDLDIALRKLRTLKEVQEKWCSLCPRLAQFRCCAGQQGVGNSGGPVGEAGGVNGSGSGSIGVIGCGLLLCLRCALRLDAVDGNVDVMIRTVESEGTSEEYPLGLRADVEFLTRDGPLMRYYFGSA